MFNHTFCAVILKRNQTKLSSQSLRSKMDNAALFASDLTDQVQKVLRKETDMKIFLRFIINMIIRRLGACVSRRTDIITLQM